MKHPEELSEHVLSQFTGSEHWYRHGLVRNILYTDGAKHIADNAEAYWLLDEIAFAQRFEEAVKREEFQVWKLEVDLQKCTGELTCGDGDGRIVYSKTLTFTDFPVSRIELWFENNTIYLPSER
jgi:hypothetical protein